jgi:ABC-type dipeptide/oligopeptide/nickel transport system permease component
MVRMTKKIKGSTLLETVIATVIILAVFFVSSLIVNNIAKQLLTSNHYEIENRIEQLNYLRSHKAIDLPYEEEYQDYEIYIADFKRENILYTSYNALNKKNNDSIVKYFVTNED